MASLAIVSPGYPVMQGGVTHHTARIHSNWSAQGHDVRVVSEAIANAPSLRVVEQADATLIQYVPFLYSRRGLSSSPMEFARRSRRSVSFIHETWVPPTRLPWKVLSPLQKKKTLGLVANSDVSVTPVPRWADEIGASLLRVGATSPGATVSDAGGGGVAVFSPFAAGLNWEWIGSALDHLSLHDRFTVVGSSLHEAEKDGAIARHIRPGWGWTGFLSSDDIPFRLAAFDLILAPFIDGLTGRRTSAMAALQVGVPLVSSDGHLADDLFRDVVEMPSSEEDFIHAVERSIASTSGAQRSAIRSWYAEHLSSEKLDKELLQHMVAKR